MSASRLPARNWKPLSSSNPVRCPASPDCSMCAAVWEGTRALSAACYVVTGVENHSIIYEDPTRIASRTHSHRVEPRGSALCSFQRADVGVEPRWSLIPRRSGAAGRPPHGHAAPARRLRRPDAKAAPSLAPPVRRQRGRAMPRRYVPRFASSPRIPPW